MTGFAAAALLRGYVPALVWAAFVLWLGSLSDVPAPHWDLPLDKAVHLILYGVLGCLAAVGWKRAGRAPRAAVVIAVVALLGAADELHQRSVPGRSAELADWAVDVLGAAVGFAAVRRSAAP